MNTIHNNVTEMFSITDLDVKIYDYMITFVFTHILPEALLLIFVTGVGLGHAKQSVEIPTNI